MMSWLRTTRAKVMLAIIFAIALLVTWPLRAAFGMFGLKDMGVAARSLRGPIWWGGAEQLQVHGVELGSVSVFLNPLQLLIGRVRINVARQLGTPDDLAGAITIGWGRRGIEDVTGTLALAAPLAPLPISRVEFEELSIAFSGGRCVNAEGRVRARVPAIISGFALANGLSGEARCAGDAVELPLVSQSGQEQLTIRVDANGAYQATMRVRTTDPILSGALGASGFRTVGGEQVLRTVGHL